MTLGQLPFVIIASRAAESALGRDVAPAALAALRAILRNRKSLEIAHQQVQWRGALLAFSSHIGAEGDVILRLDMGDPRLSDRLVLESEYRKASRQRR